MKTFGLGWALLNGYEGIVNVALIHANRLAFGWTEWRKRSIPTHSEWLYPLTFDAGKGLKEA